MKFVYILAITALSTITSCNSDGKKVQSQQAEKQTKMPLENVTTGEIAHELESIPLNPSSIPDYRTQMDHLKDSMQNQIDTGAMTAEISTYYGITDSMLNVVYTDLMSRIDSQSKTALRTQQRSWLKERDLEFKNIFNQDIDGEKLGEMLGTMGFQIMVSQKSQVVEKRVYELIKMTENL